MTVFPSEVVEIPKHRGRGIVALISPYLSAILETAESGKALKIVTDSRDASDVLEASVRWHFTPLRYSTGRIVGPNPSALYRVHCKHVKTDLYVWLEKKP